MKYTFLLFLAVISCQTNKNCKDYKTGVFKFANPKYAEWTVYRTDSTQIEVSNITSTEIHNNVKWISDCEYHLGKTKIINNKLNFQEMDTMKVEIYKTEDDRYFCYSKSNRLDLELEMIKIREIDD